MTNREDPGERPGRVYVVTDISSNYGPIAVCSNLQRAKAEAQDRFKFIDLRWIMPTDFLRWVAPIDPKDDESDCYCIITLEHIDAAVDYEGEPSYDRYIPGAPEPKIFE